MRYWEDKWCTQKKPTLKLGPCMIAGTLFPCGTWLEKKETFIDVEEKYSDSWVGKDEKHKLE